MTATLPAPSATLPASEEDWPEQLARALRPSCFPARQDEMLATLIRLRAPSHLLWRLACLPRTRRFGSLAEVLDYVKGHLPVGAVAEPR